jgi:hypothetical protein
MSVLLTTRDAARILALSPRTLERLRLSGDGPRFCKLRRSVRYRQADLELWASQNSVASTSEARHA